MTWTERSGETDEIQVFVFEVVMGVSSLAFAVYLGYEMGAFAAIRVGLMAGPIVGGALLGTFAVLGLESDTVRVLSENFVARTILTVVVIGCIAVVVWVVSRVGTIQAVYAAMGLITASLATRGYVFAQRMERTGE